VILPTASTRTTTSVVVAALLLLAGGLVAAVTRQGPERVVRAPTGYTPAAASRESELGRQLYVKLDCAACHSIGGRGGTAGPPLDGVGARRGEQTIVMQLSDPAKLAAEHPERHRWEPSYMPHPTLTARQVTLLTAYLLTLPEPAGGFASDPHTTSGVDETPLPEGRMYLPTARSELSDRGERLFFRSGCATCHAIGRYGGDFAPRLDGIGGRRSRAYISSHVTNPTLHTLTTPGARPEPSLMPQRPLPAADVEAIVAFLMTVPDLGDR
jgi:mono/diheme cytochrome c family protein